MCINIMYREYAIVVLLLIGRFPQLTFNKHKTHGKHKRLKESPLPSILLDTLAHTLLFAYSTRHHHFPLLTISESAIHALYSFIKSTKLAFGERDGWAVMIVWTGVCGLAVKGWWLVEPEWMAGVGIVMLTVSRLFWMDTMTIMQSIFLLLASLLRLSCMHENVMIRIYDYTLAVTSCIHCLRAIMMQGKHHNPFKN
jgi:hypothetical protein